MKIRLTARLVTSASLFLLLCGMASADQCGDLVDKWNRTNTEAHGYFKLFLDRHLPQNSCDERVAECAAHRASLDTLRRLMASVDGVFDACGPRFRSKLGLDKSAMRKAVQDDISHAEANVAYACRKERLTTGCFSMDGL
jgi:hypothetical protein